MSRYWSIINKSTKQIIILVFSGFINLKIARLIIICWKFDLLRHLRFLMTGSRTLPRIVYHPILVLIRFFVKDVTDTWQNLKKKKKLQNDDASGTAQTCVSLTLRMFLILLLPRIWRRLINPFLLHRSVHDR